MEVRQECIKSPWLYNVSIDGYMTEIKSRVEYFDTLIRLKCSGSEREKFKITLVVYCQLMVISGK